MDLNISARQGPIPSRRHGNRRGLALLLYNYLIVFMLCMFTMTMLSRGTLDLSHAQQHIQTDQSFWAAEGVLEQAMAQMRVSTTDEGPQAPTCTATDGDGIWLAFQSVTGLGTYRWCVDAVLASTPTQERRRYRIEATGTAGGFSRMLSTMVEYDATMFVFNHVSVADQIVLDHINTGGMDSRSSSMPANTTFRGDLATNATAMTRCGALPCPPIIIRNGSRVQGNAYVGPGGQSEHLDLRLGQQQAHGDERQSLGARATTHVHPADQSGESGGHPPV